jgi:propionyl-CoA synthetase
LKGQTPLALVVTKLNDSIEHFQLEQEIINLVRQQIGAVASLRNVVIVERLPKTRSGKTLRKLMRSIADGDDYIIPSTIDDETIVEEIAFVLEKYEIGTYNKKQH